MYIKRHLETTIEKLNSCFKVLLVTGPRQVGKTTLLRRLAASDRTCCAGWQKATGLM